MPKITVITPVYNAASYLDRCLESLMAQTFSDFEVILVDDGSADGSGALCDLWAERDTRVRVIHQANAGQAAARNRALDIARGEYIAFVDSDDYVHPRFLETLLSNLLDAGADVSVCRYLRTPNSREDADYVNRPILYGGPEYVRRGLLGEIPCGVWLLWDKLFRAECFREVRLPEGRINEDNATVYKILYECHHIVDTDAILYFYFENRDSTVLQTFRKKHLDWLLVPEEMIAFFSQKGDAVLEDKCRKMLLSELTVMLQKVRRNLKDPSLEQDLRRRLLAHFRAEKKRYPITLQTHPALFEALYLTPMKVYWTLRGIQSKFRR